MLASWCPLDPLQSLKNTDCQLKTRKGVNTKLKIAFIHGASSPTQEYPFDISSLFIQAVCLSLFHSPCNCYCSSCPHPQKHYPPLETSQLHCLHSISPQVKYYKVSLNLIVFSIQQVTSSCPRSRMS